MSIWCGRICKLQPSATLSPLMVALSYRPSGTDNSFLIVEAKSSLPDSSSLLLTNEDYGADF